MGKYVSKMNAWTLNPVILPEIVQMLVALTKFVNCLMEMAGDLRSKKDLAGLIGLNKEEFKMAIV